jgi:hypothetical protein
MRAASDVRDTTRYLAGAVTSACAAVLVGVVAYQLRDVPHLSAERSKRASLHGTLRPVTLDGLGNPNNYGFHRLYHFQGWLWTVSGNSAQGAIVYRSTDGEHWEAVSPPGIDGDLANDSIVSMAWFHGADDPPGSKGKLYVTTFDYRAEGDNQHGGDIFRANADAEDPADIVWETITKNGFGDETRLAFDGLVVLKDHLYAGTFVASPNGSDVFRTSTGDPGDWHPVITRGFGDLRCVTDVHVNIVFGDHGYFTPEQAGCLGEKGAEIWRTTGDALVDDQTSTRGWEKVAVGGFGDRLNNVVFGMDVFLGYFYAATWVWVDPGTSVWRAPVRPPYEGVTPVPFAFEQVSVGGFGAGDNFNTGMVHLGDTLYVTGIDGQSVSNGHFYRTSGDTVGDGRMLDWIEITADGFPPPAGHANGAYDGPSWVEVFKGKVYVAVDQWGHGEKARGQIWVYEPVNVPRLKITAATDRLCPGGRVTIGGIGFDDYQGWENYAELNGLPIRTIKWTDTEIIAEIPAGSEPGPAQMAVYRDGETSNLRRVTVLPADGACGQAQP